MEVIWIISSKIWAKMEVTNRVFIRHQGLENSPFPTQNSPANVQYPMTNFYSDMEPVSKYSPVMLNLSPATRILNENLEQNTCFASQSIPCQLSWASVLYMRWNEFIKVGLFTVKTPVILLKIIYEFMFNVAWSASYRECWQKFQGKCSK